MSLTPGSERDRPFVVVFVCSGNRARSPLALELFRRHSTNARVSVGSFGTLDLGSVPALPEAVRAGRLVGVDLSGHRTRTIVPSCLAGADLVVGFEPFHVACSIVDGGAAPGRTFTLPELAELADRVLLPPQLSGVERARAGVAEAERLRAADGRGGPPSMADPFGKPQQVFDRLAREIDALTARLALRLLAPLEGIDAGSGSS